MSILNKVLSHGADDLGTISAASAGSASGMSSASSLACDDSRCNIRPALSPLLLALALAFLSSVGAAIFSYSKCLAVLQADWLFALIANPFNSAVLLLIPLILLIVGIRYKHNAFIKYGLLAVAAALAAFITSLCYYTGVNLNATILAENQITAARVTVTSDPNETVYNKYSIARLELDGRTANVRINWQKDAIVAPLGSSFDAEFEFSSLKANDEQLFYQGVCGYLKIIKQTEAGFGGDLFATISAFRDERLQFLNQYTGDGASICSAMLLGNRLRLNSSDLKQDFKVTGLTHLIAVSGSHLAVIAVLLAWTLRKLPIASVVAIIVLVATLAAYVVLTACQPSAIRAAIMALCAALSQLAGRRAHCPSALVFAATAMIIVAPGTAFSLAFWLSVFAVLGIAMFAGFANGWFLAVLGNQVKKFAIIRQPLATITEMLSVSACAQLATTPLSIPAFAMFSCVSPIANLFVVPLMTVLVGFGIIILCLPLPILSSCGFLLNCICVLADIIADIAKTFAKIPFAAIPASADMIIAVFIGLVIAALLYWFWPRPTVARIRVLLIGCLALVIFLQLLAPGLRPANLVMLDVGQGDAILIRDGRRAMLVDTGPSATALLDALGREGINELDCVVITHLDNDHCGALDALRGTVVVHDVAFAQGLLEAKYQSQAIQSAIKLVGKDNIIELEPADLFSFSSKLAIEVLWPNTPALKGDNPESLCLLLSYTGNNTKASQTVLLTGDAEAPELQQLLSVGMLANRQIDIIKIGHHGSDDAVRGEQLRQLSPQLALISVGNNNRYCHPTKETMQTLADANLPILCTKDYGDVTIEFEADGFNVRCAKILE